MNQLKLVSIFFIVLCFAATANAQTKVKPKQEAAETKIVFSEQVRSSPAFAELILVRTELESGIESLLIDHTESYPKIVEDRYHLAMIDIALRRIAIIKPAETGKLTLALGKMLLRAAELETDLWGLKLIYTDSHPEVKQGIKKLAIYEAAIKDILGS
jgi:hypothetical protein